MNNLMWSRQVIWSCASGQHILKQTRLNASLEMYGNLGARNDRQYFRQPPHRSRKFYVQKHVDTKNKSRINDSEHRKPAHAQLRMHLLRPNQPKNNSNKCRMQKGQARKKHGLITSCRLFANSGEISCTVGLLVVGLGISIVAVVFAAIGLEGTTTNAETHEETDE